MKTNKQFLAVLWIIAGLSSGLAMPSAALARSFWDVGIYVNVAPPPLPIYAQPPIPGPDYIWTPGYWAWNQDAQDYYWVPGTWVLAPYPGYLWTPGYWGWEGRSYRFHNGYWGPHVGYYGGISYGFGYNGFGFDGGFWRGGHYFYNRRVNNINNYRITNVYDRNVNTHYNTTRFSYNGPGGINIRPRPEELRFNHEAHFPPNALQLDHIQRAARFPTAFSAHNRGVPQLAATPVVGHFSDSTRQEGRSWPGSHPSGSYPLGSRPAGVASHEGRPHNDYRPAPLPSSTPRPWREGADHFPQPRPESRPNPGFSPRHGGGFDHGRPAASRPAQHEGGHGGGGHGGGNHGGGGHEGEAHEGGHG